VAQVVTNGSLNATGTDVGYTVELRISWSDLGVTPSAGHFLRIDPAVGDRDGDPPPVQGQSFDWAGLANFNNPSAWKDVKLVIDNTPPAAPTNLSLAVVSSSQIDVSWSPSGAADVARYRIYRGTTGTPSLVDSVPASPYHDTELAASTPYTYQVTAVDAAGNTSQHSAAATATTPGGSGIPFGPSQAFDGTTLRPNNEHFNLAHQEASAPNIEALLNAARTRNFTILTNMTGGAHSNYLTNGLFDMAKWKAKMNTLDTDSIRAAVEDAVAGGYLIGNSVMDEPPHPTWCEGRTPSNWCITKAMVDQMCDYVKGIFPTLPVGVVHRHDHPDFEPAKNYAVCDFVLSQYGFPQGVVSDYRDSGLAFASRSGISILFGMNLLDGGIPRKQWETHCDPETTGGDGTFGLRCRMTAKQVRDFGAVLGPEGCGFRLWRYDGDSMGKEENQQAFADLAALLAATPTGPCVRH
jgi:hypothetical protein